MAFTEKQDSQTGLIIPEYESEEWQNQYYRNHHILNWLLHINAIQSRLKSGRWDGSDLTDIIVEFAESGKVGVETVSFPDKAVAITATHQIWYANRDTGVIESVDLVAYDEITFDDDHFPLLYTGHYQQTGAATAAFSRFIGIRSNPKIEFVDQPDMVVVPQAQITNYADSPKIAYYDFATKTFKQRLGDARAPTSGDWTRINEIETLTADLEFPDTYDNPKIDVDRKFQIDPGNQGSNVPFAIYVRGNGGEINLRTTKSIENLIALQAGTLPTSAELKNQQYIKNRGAGNHIVLNGEQIYSGGRPTEFEYPLMIQHPYIFPSNGYSYHGVAKAGVNDDETLLIDAWRALGGFELLEISPIHNPFTALSFWYKFYTPDDAGQFRRIGTPFGGTSGVDPDIHDRTSPVSSAAITSGNYTSPGSTNEISGISDTNIKNVKIWARIYDAGLGIPGPNSGTKKTTVIGKIIQNATDNNSVFLFDSETGAAANVTATGDLTIDMGGNSGKSLQHTAMWGHFHEFAVLSTNSLGSRTGPQTVYGGTLNASGPVYNSNAGGYVSVPSNDGVNGAPYTASESRPKSTQTYKYIHL